MDDPHQQALAAGSSPHNARRRLRLIEQAPDKRSSFSTPPAASRAGTRAPLAMLNIGLNARDAMQAGGQLRISAANISLDDKRLGLAGPFVRLAISDKGSGIPPNLLEKVIEPFFTTKEAGKGSGLGLSQAHGFARQSRSAGAPPSPSTSPPRSRACLASPASHPAPGPQPQNRGSVLVVEDDLVVAELAVAALEDRGYAVSVAHCAPEALEQFEAGNRFDLVFSDIIMPGRMNGVELAQTIRSCFPDIPVLLTTGYSAAAFTEAATHFPLITTPYKLQDLTDHVTRLFGMRGPEKYPASSRPEARPGNAALIEKARSLIPR